MKSYRPELKDIATEDLVAIRGYTSDDYYEINQALRDKDAKALEEYEAYIKCAVSGLNQMQSYNGVVTRGVDLPPTEAAKYKKGAIVTEDAFTSSSSDSGAAFGGNTKFTILSKNGKDVSFISENMDEEEILFAPNTKFRVLDVEVDPKSGIRKIRMQELSDKQGAK